jgi:hypothetical protein
MQQTTQQPKKRQGVQDSSIKPHSKQYTSTGGDAAAVVHMHP